MIPRPSNETTWSLLEGLATGTVRGPDHAYPMRGHLVMSTELNTAWVLGEGYIRLSPLLNKGVSCYSSDSWCLFLVVSPLPPKELVGPNNRTALTVLRGRHHRYFRLDPRVPGALWAFHFLRNQGTPSGSESIQTTCVSLYSLQVSERCGSLTGQLFLDINLVYPV